MLNIKVGTIKRKRGNRLRNRFSYTIIANGMMNVKSEMDLLHLLLTCVSKIEELSFISLP